MFLPLFTVVVLAWSAIGQTLPVGKWRLEEYKFGAKAERPLDKIDITLNVKADGKLGGDSGCNAYGGSYSATKDALWIGDIISTMRACEEPTPAFEKSFFSTLESAATSEVKNDKLIIKDKTGSRFLRFLRAHQ
jgi:putative lipoprotein